MAIKKSESAKATKPSEVFVDGITGEPIERKDRSRKSNKSSETVIDTSVGAPPVDEPIKQSDIPDSPDDWGFSNTITDGGSPDAIIKEPDGVDTSITSSTSTAPDSPIDTLPDDWTSPPLSADAEWDGGRYVDPKTGEVWIDHPIDYKDEEGVNPDAYAPTYQAPKKVEKEIDAQTKRAAQVLSSVFGSTDFTNGKAVGLYPGQSMVGSTWMDASIKVDPKTGQIDVTRKIDQYEKPESRLFRKSKPGVRN